MTDLTNVNTFTADTIRLINKNLDKPVNAGEQRVLDEIKGLKPDNDTKLNILDFGTNGRLLKLLQDSNLIDNVNYTGVNKHSAFIEVAQEIFQESDNIKFLVSDNVNEDLPEIKFDVIVNINNLQREFNPNDLLNEIDLIDSPNKFIVFPSASLYGQGLDSDLRITSLENGVRIVTNRFTPSALSELAEESGLTLRIFSDNEIDSVALLLKKPKAITKIIKKPEVKKISIVKEPLTPDAGLGTKPNPFAGLIMTIRNPDGSILEQREIEPNENPNELSEGALEAEIIQPEEVQPETKTKKSKLKT